MAKVKLGQIGHWNTKSAAQKFADEKNKRSRKYRYSVSRPSFFGKPGFEGVPNPGWTLNISRKG